CPPEDQSRVPASRNRSPGRIPALNQGLAPGETRVSRAGREAGAAAPEPHRPRTAADEEQEVAGVRGARRHNLPASLTSFVGRETTLSEAPRLPDCSRLPTVRG